MNDGKDNDWKPQPATGRDVRELKLSAEEGYVLSRLDGTTSVAHLTQLVSLPQDRIESILGRLVQEGAVRSDNAPLSLRARNEPPSSTGETTSVRTESTEAAVAPIESHADKSASPSAESHTTHREASASTSAPASAETRIAHRESSASTSASASAEARTTHREASAGASARPKEATQARTPLRQSATRVDPEIDAPDHGPATASEDEEDDEELAEVDVEDRGVEDAVVDVGNYRQLFETRLHPLERDERVAMARLAEGAYLCAFCFDPDPGVIRSVFENALCGLEHARLVAAYHHNAAGLDALATHHSFLMDPQVQRMLLRNPQLPDRLFQRLVGPKPLLELHRMMLNRDLPERTRRASSTLLRNRFSQCAPDERVEFLFSTEGRVLPALAGLHFDGRTIALLCARMYYPNLLIHNLARFAGTPAPVLTHLSRLEAVKRQPLLRSMLAQHPNAPAELKRRSH